MHLIALTARWRGWFVGNILLIALCVSSYGQGSAIVFYVDAGVPSGTTQPGINATDSDNLHTLGLMVQQLNAGHPVAGSGAPFYTWTVQEVTSFADVAAYQAAHTVDRAYVVAHAVEIPQPDGSVTYTQPDSNINVGQANALSLKTADAASAAGVSESDMYYCGKYGDEKAIDADDMGASVAAKTSQTYPANVTQKGALDPTKSGGRPNNSGSGAATSAPQTVPNTGVNGYWQSIDVYWETWTTYPGGGGLLTGHYSTSWAWMAIPGSGGGNPGNTVQN